MYTDFIWLFKYKLYTNEKFLNDIFNEFKIMQQKQLTNNFNLLRILRIFNDYLALYFDSKKVQLKFKNPDEGDSDDDSEPDTSENAVRIILIKSPAYYRTIHYEISLTFLKRFILKLLSFDFEPLNALEKLIYLVNYNFAVKKNFLPKNDIFNEEKNYAKLRENHENLFRPYIKCSICSQNLNFFNCLELKAVECNLGHKLNRCEKSLLLLDYKNYKCCFVCGCAWNAYSSVDLQNFRELFDIQNTCAYCN